MTADQLENWNYSEKSELGPSAWPKYFGAGQFQSPINILVDFCDLHQTRRVNCAQHSTANHKQTQNQISRQLKSLLNINNSNNDHQQQQQQHSQHHHHHNQHKHHNNNNNNNNNNNGYNNKVSPNTRRDHLDSEGNDESVSTMRAMDDNGQAFYLSLAQTETIEPGDKRNQFQQQQRQNTRYCVTNKKIFLGYPRYLNTLKLTNTGHGWQADLPAELTNHTLVCGPALADQEYRLAQFHCHWGADCQSGSEHRLNGQSFAAEIHFVHWNCSMYKSAQEASRHKHGLAVLGVFVEALEGDQHKNKHLDKIIRGLEAIADWPESASSSNATALSARSTTTLQDTKLDLKKLFPANRWDYASYEGSLTTPPLSEVVDWIVFLEPIRCSSSQIDQFRRLKCPAGPLLTNCRPVQALNSRTVTIWTHAHHHSHR